MSMMDVEQQSPQGLPNSSEIETGIIYPPPDIRKMIDKAAANLATKSEDLEKKIRDNNKDGRFNFLNPTDPYYAYYRAMYKKVQEGTVLQTDGSNIDQNKEASTEELINIAPKEPESFEFSAPMPAMSAQDLDIMKLTAQFAARNGRIFISQLATRESRNYQFDFLRSSHSLFPYFTELIKQYKTVFFPPKDLSEKLDLNYTNKYHILERVKERVEWVVYQEAEKKKRNDENEKERIAYASIDWNDFVVVETVEFTESDEQSDLPPPMSLAELENMSLAQKRLASMPATGLEDDQNKDSEDVEMEESDEEMPLAPVAPKIPDTNAPIKIRTDYKPKLFGTQIKATTATQLCPRCGEAIPISEMDEHMRIELLDPKWKEQKMAMEAKQRDSNLLQEGNDVAKILKGISSLRPDIFGSDEVDANKRIREQEEEAKKKDRVIWDGHTATMGLANQRAQKTSIDDQIAQMHKRIAGDDIGPQIPGQQRPPPPQMHQQYPPPTYNNPYMPPQPYQPPQPYYGNQTYINPQAPGMYNNGMSNPPSMAPPVAVSPSPISPAVRKLEESDSESAAGTPEKKPRADAPAATNTEPEWQQPQGITLSVTIQTPSMPDKPEWNLTGNAVTISGLSPNTLISTVKDRIASQLGMPAGKQKLSLTNTVLNNSKTMSFYNITDNQELVLEVRKR